MKAPSFPLASSTDIRDRGAEDVSFHLRDGLNQGPSRSHRQSRVIKTDQTDIIRVFRGIFRLASKKYWDQIKRDLRPIDTTANMNADMAAFDAMAEKMDCARTGDCETLG